MSARFTYYCTTFSPDSIQANLTSSQSNTLRAVSRRITEPTSSLETLLREPATTSPHDFQIGLDELDALTRDRAGYPFAELCSSLQQAVLSLIASHDLIRPDFDLASWLEGLRRDAAALDLSEAP